MATKMSQLASQDECILSLSSRHPVALPSNTNCLRLLIPQTPNELKVLHSTNTNSKASLTFQLDETWFEAKNVEVLV